MKVLIAGLCGGSSGIEIYTRALIRALADLGTETIVVDRSPDARGGDTETEALRLPIRRPGRRVQKLLASLEAVRVQREIRATADSLGATLIHASRPQLAPPTDLPLIVTAWDPLLGVLKRGLAARGRGDVPRKELAYAVTDRIAYRRASGIVAVTASVQRALESLAKPVVHIPAFVDDDSIRPGGRDRTRRCVMVAGRLDDRRKGLALAIEAVARARRTLPDLRLVLIGGWRDGNLQRDLPSFCEVRGRLSRIEVADELRAAACCILPSMWEEFGYVGLEALAVGTPLVCGQLPAFTDLDADAGVVIARRRDRDVFARAIRDALDVGSFQFPDRFRASTAVQRIKHLYEQVTPR